MPGNGERMRREPGRPGTAREGAGAETRPPSLRLLWGPRSRLLSVTFLLTPVSHLPKGAVDPETALPAPSSGMSQVPTWKEVQATPWAAGPAREWHCGRV